MNREFFMSTRFHRHPALQVLYVLLPFMLLAMVGAEEPKLEVRMINYQDLLERVRIIGKLGRPLGELVTVRGKWTAVEREKPTLPIFIIYQLNGKPLNPPAEFEHIESVTNSDQGMTRTAGEVWELHGAETGGFEGFSEDVWKEVPGYKVSAHTPGGFITRFYFARARRISGTTDNQ
jgi:hypothetical protein